MLIKNDSEKTQPDVDDEKPRDPFARMKPERAVFHCLRKPESVATSMSWTNPHYQMQWSVMTLENQLAEEGNPHVLQLNAFCHEFNRQDWKNPDVWYLYADGYLVASGDGVQARRCFEESAETFRDLCREAIENAGLGELSAREYQLLSRARDIASVEPFDKGSNSHGAREGRV